MRPTRPAAAAQPIHTGIGGWTFAAWRGPFYPEHLLHAQELAYAAQRLTAIEINGTFYRTQTPASFAKWRAAAPDGFVFAVKAPRAATHRADLADAEAAITRFLNSGLVELGDRLGPILWQFPPTRIFDPAVSAAFLALLPPEHGGLALRHVVETRHASFVNPEWFAQLRKHQVARGNHRLRQAPLAGRSDSAVRLRPPATQQQRRAGRLRG